MFHVARIIQIAPSTSFVGFPPLFILLAIAELTAGSWWGERRGDLSRYFASNRPINGLARVVAQRFVSRNTYLTTRISHDWHSTVLRL